MSLKASLTPSLWKAKVREKIEKGMASLPAGRALPTEEVWAKLERIVAVAEKRPGPVRK